ncbi:MAG: tRNA dihydrouridine synthase DusB [Spirochaetaceae bacterium]|jgi:nifR3 family TIM-barrel protein|nr:tRNA dihydrouridine synthase DusB [Spirochaetaceae bacterium]
MSLYQPVRVGPLTLSGNLFLAPVAGYTERAFRSLCVEQGADLTFTELISSEALVRNPAPTEPLLRRAQNERRYAIQLFGGSEETMAQAASIVLAHKPALIDINAGCPVPKVTKTGAGAALMKDPARLARIVAAVKKAAGPDTPVSVKIRSGWDAQTINCLECAQASVEAGAAMVSLHPRTRAQGYEGRSDWRHITNLAARLKVPVAGSGDLYTPEDAQRMLEETGCAAVMFARGAIGNPHIFSHTRAHLLGRALPPTTPRQRIQAAFRHLELLVQDAGETKACLEMRKTFCAYVKGGPGAATLRNSLVRASAVAEYRHIISRHFDDEEDAVPPNPLLKTPFDKTARP